MIKIKKGPRLWNDAKKIIPGGNQLLSKRSEMFLPNGWPSYYEKAKGVAVWDLDGNEFIDMSIMGIGSCILGYADPDVNKAVKKAIDDGSMSTLNCPEEVQLAKLLCKIHSWADMVRYARTGGESMAIAIRIARAFTGRDKVAFCGYHGWSDWYLSSNLADGENLDGQLLPGLEPKGVPRGLVGTTLPFRYNHIEDLEKITSQNKDVGAIVVEPLRHEQPKNGFLEKVRKLARKSRAVLIFDEISVGWRLNVGGVHLLYNVEPDIAVFGKAMSNGFPMAAIIGKRQVMSAAQDTFISSTYWTERIGPVAALATIEKLSEKDVPKHLERTGKEVMKGLETTAKEYGLKITVSGPPCMVAFTFDYGDESLAIRTLFTQEMLKLGFLASSLIYITYAHRKTHIDQYFKAVDKTFAVISKAINENKVLDLLEGPVAHSGFARLT